MSPRDFHTRKALELREEIDQIMAIQQESLVFTEFYRNSRITTSADYRRLLEAGNNTFGLARLYESVQEKLEHSHAIVTADLNELRNIVLDFLQWVAVVFAAITAAKDILNPLVVGLLLPVVKRQPKWANITDVEQFTKSEPVLNAGINIGIVIVVTIVLRYLIKHTSVAWIFSKIKSFHSERRNSGQAV
jgi:hypothetical protein